MKKLMPKLSIGISLFFLLISFQAEAKRKAMEKTKTVSKSFSVNPQHQIYISNKFGKVNVTTWDQNELSLSVTILVKQPNEKKAQEILDEIEIKIKEGNDKLSITTEINKNGDKYKMKSNGNSELSIDYELKIPSSNMLEIKNSFGSLFLDSRAGLTKVDLSFGSATIGDLSGSDNQLEFQFSDPVVIGNVNKGKITLKHSKMELMSASDLVLASEMSTCKIDRIEKGQLSLKFGSLELSDVKELQINAQMSTLKIDKLHSKATIENNYGSLSINRVAKGIKELTIESEFSPVKLYLEEDGSYKMDANVSMAGLKLPPNSIEEEKIYSEDKPVLNTNKAFKGRIGGKSNQTGKIKIKSSFGDVKVMLTE